MNFIIYINDTFEEEKALYDLDKKEVILKGDYYHDKIDYQIMGYLLALEVDKEDIAEDIIDSTHVMFDKLEFYNDNFED
ncbi:hypothetical protein [Psychrobacillus phage Perkons]|nr:hypothetical protein [Psychrobacillus phage Perkons]